MRKHIPNIITCLNLVCGTCAVILTLWGFYWPAFCFILAGAVFDFCDGAAARLLKAYSNIGKELDSLSDLVSFGLAPALMFFSWYYKINNAYPSSLAFIPLLIVPFSALRLAKFNLDERQTKSFLGLPTPALAMMVGAITAHSHLCIESGIDTFLLQLMQSSWFIPVLSVVLSLLLVSEIPMFSLKGKGEDKAMAMAKQLFPIGIVLIAIFWCIFAPKQLPILADCFAVLSLTFFAYLILQLILPIFVRRSK